MTDHLTMIDVICGKVELIDNRPNGKPVRNDPIAKAHAALVLELSRLHVPQIQMSPSPEDFDDLADYLRRVTALFDMIWLQPIGAEVAANALCHIDQKMFSEQFLGAIDGNATHELQCASEAAQEAEEYYVDQDDFDRDYRAESMRGE